MIHWDEPRLDRVEHTGVTIGNATSTMAESDEKGHRRIKATP
jgi:hypothetical protein